jgi:Ca2+-transporting ATPase
MGHVLAVRSVRDPIYKIGFFSNMALIWSVVLTNVLQLGVIYLPFMQKIFDTHPLNVFELIVCLLASAVIFFSIELSKRLRK